LYKKANVCLSAVRSIYITADNFGGLYQAVKVWKAIKKHCVLKDYTIVIFSYDYIYLNNFIQAYSCNVFSTAEYDVQ